MRGDMIIHAPQHYREITKLSKSLEKDVTIFFLIRKVGIVSSLNLRKFGKKVWFYLRIEPLFNMLKYVKTLRD